MNYDCICFSAHPDDVALSIGAFFANLCRRIPVMLVTAFTRSRYIDHSIVDYDVSSTRVLEDMRYAERVQSGYSHFNMPDRSFLNLDHAEEEFHFDQRFNNLLSRVNEVVLSISPKFVLAPLAIGGHIDHRLLSYAVNSLPGTRTVWYYDLPYAALSLSDFNDTIGRSSLFQKHFDFRFGKKENSERESNIGLYRSQHLERFLSDINSYLYVKSDMYSESLVGTEKSMHMITDHF